MPRRGWGNAGGWGGGASGRRSIGTGSRRTTRTTRPSAPRGAPRNLTTGSVLSGAGQGSDPIFREYWGDINYAPTERVTTPSGLSLNRSVGGYQGTREGYEQYRVGRTAGMGGEPTAPAAPDYLGGGGGGGYGGGGGGGGGGGAMTQAMFDAMLQTLGVRGPQLNLQQTDLPDFRGTNVPAFNAQPYTQLSNNLATAVARDRAAIQTGANQTTAALGAYSANPYAAAQAAPPPQAQAQGAALQATAGGAPNAPNANAAAAGAASAQGGAETAAFNDLLKVLGGNYQQAQNSRLGQVQMDAQSARNQLGAQQLGLGSQIGMQRANAYEQWRQQDAERRYQNSLMSQQWNREEMTRNQDIYNQQAQGNWQQRNEMINNRLTPLLQLIQGTAGTNVNMDALTKMLSGLAA
jgi:hypothetical protein